MTDHEIAEKAIKLFYRGMSENEVITYVYEQVERNDYRFKDIWQEVLYWFEFFDNEYQREELMIPDLPF